MPPPCANTSPPSARARPRARRLGKSKAVAAVKARCNARRRTSPRGRRSIARSPSLFPPTVTIGAQTLTDFVNGDGAVQAHIDGHGLVEADVLVATDGAQSPTRQRFLPDLRSTYAGYVAWRGTLEPATRMVGAWRSAISP
jgi:hypothetical protein